jgi:hypothetical protein
VPATDAASASILEGDMRQISIEEAAAVGGADCGDLTMSVGITGVTVSGSLENWGSCVDAAANWLSDTYTGISSHYITGIPYGEAHVA